MCTQTIGKFCNILAEKKGRMMVTMVSTIISLFLFSGSAFSGKFKNSDLLKPEKIGRADFATFALDRKIQNNEFTLHEIGERVVTFHQRKIGEAIVEKDFLNYQFDKETGQYLKRKVHWRDDLPEVLPPLGVTKGEAENIAKMEAYGDVAFSELYIISPESDVFPINPTPRNPCWVVRINEGGGQAVIIIDAVTGTFLGRGVPPPSQGFTLSGPINHDPCSVYWGDYQNAQTWFINMGYPTDAKVWPTKATIQSYLQNPETKLFFGVGHSGDSSGFATGCSNGNNLEFTTASNIKTWLSSANKIPFSFIESCYILCDTRANTLSYELRKGSFQNTTTVGGCELPEPQCGSCSIYTFENELFQYMSQGLTVKQAYDRAMADYPVCAAGPCVRFDGDMSFRVPVFIATNPPGKATLIAPSGTIYTSATTTFKWYAVANATSYLLWVRDSAGTKIRASYTPAVAGCANGPAFCSVTLTGSYTSACTWSIQTSTSAGAGPWSDNKTFSTNTSTPGVATLVYPSGNWFGLTKTPTYLWNAVSNATSYTLWVADSAGGGKTFPYSADQAGCADGVTPCSVTPTTTIADGTARWSIQASNPAGSNSWSNTNTLSFTAITGVPGKPTSISPSGIINTNKPTYTWNAMANSTRYQLVINTGASQTIAVPKYTPTQTGCANGTGTCSVTPTDPLPEGPYSWYLHASNPNGGGLYNDSKTFTVISRVPDKPTVISPVGNTCNTKPTFSWNALPNATSYTLAVLASNVSYQNTYTANQVGCGSYTGTCSITPTTQLGNGVAIWAVAAANNLGSGPASNTTQFTVFPTLGNPSLVSPSGTINTYTPTFTWNAAANASSYLLTVLSSNGYYQNTYTPAQAGCASGTGTCSVTPTTPLPNGSAFWWLKASNSNCTGSDTNSIMFMVSAGK